MPRLFEDTPVGRQRSVYFAMGVATGFLCIVAATTALLQSTTNSLVATALILLGSTAFGFSAMVALGRFDWVLDVG